MNKLTLYLLTLLIGGCVGCVSRKTLRIESEPSEKTGVWYSPKVLDNFAKWFTYMRDSTGTKVETAFCLYGYTEENVWYVLSAEMAQMQGQSRDSIQQMDVGLCETRDLIGYGHTHPIGGCELSPVDVNTFLTLPYAMTVIICPGRGQGEIGVNFITKRELLRNIRRQHETPLPSDSVRNQALGSFLRSAYG